MRQLRNIAEQLSILEEKRHISSTLLDNYLSEGKISLPALINKRKESNDFSNEREIMYKILFDMKKDLNELKKITKHLNPNTQNIESENFNNVDKLYSVKSDFDSKNIESNSSYSKEISNKDKYHFAEEIREEETLSIHDKELELIIKALERNNGKRKAAAEELGISERTLYRKIKQNDIEL